jgi:hypothetical protein
MGLFDTKDQPDMKSMSPVMVYFGGEGGTSVLALLTSKEVIKLDGNDYYSIMGITAPEYLQKKPKATADHS